MEPKRLAGILRRNALRIVLFAAFVGVGVGVVTSMMPKTYQASTTLVVAGTMLGNPPQLDQIQAATRMAQTLADLATSRPVLAAALLAAGDPTNLDAFRQQIDARAAPDSLFIIITVRAAEARSSADLANAVARQLVVQAPELLGATAPAVTSPIHTVETALPADSPISPRVLLYTLVAVVAAALAAIVVAIVADYRRRPTPAVPVVPTTPPASPGRYMAAPAMRTDGFATPVAATPPVAGAWPYAAAPPVAGAQAVAPTDSPVAAGPSEASASSAPSWSEPLVSPGPTPTRARRLREPKA